MQSRHFVQIVGLSAFWGASFPLLRIASPAFGPITLAALRCALAALVLAVLMRLLREQWPPRHAWTSLSVLGVVTLISPFVLFNFAALTLPAGYSAVFNATAPSFGVLAGALLKEERLTAAKLLGCVLGFAGVALLVQLGPVEVTWPVILAALACAGAAASYGVGSIFMRRAALAWHPLPASASVHLAAAGLLAVPSATQITHANPTWPAVMALLVLGLVTSGFMYWISMRLMREISASASTASAFLIPLFGVTWGALFLGEPVTAGMLPGCVLILVATSLITGFRPWQRSATP
ncbi:MAG: DMT family transporter [Betaproteobacteria bacterium]|jgi:drug/metabolite transporter (DMT)-like permease|nr:DMT family transporter [Betaproteobacteria bacterium]NBS45938.1 DMT family transporter [Betaproteobacteria bacterium]